MSPTIRVDDDVYEALQERGIAFVDTPNSVLRRLMGLGDQEDQPEGPTTAERSSGPAGRSKAPPRRRSARKRKRAPTGTILREEEYEIPLLQVLADREGSGPAGEVIDALGEMLDGKLMEKDRERLNSGRVRWQNRAQFVRLRLVEAGDLKQDSPRGVWEISDQGRKRLSSGSGG